MYYEPNIVAAAPEEDPFVRGIRTAVSISLLMWAPIIIACIRVF